MKRILIYLIPIIFLSIFHVAAAQEKTAASDKVYLVPNPQTARWSYLQTDAKGEPMSTIYFSVESMRGDGINGNMKLRMEEVNVASPADTVRTFAFYRFKDGEYMPDMDSFFDEDVLADIIDDSIKKAETELTEEKLEILKSEEGMKELRNKLKPLFSKSGNTRGIPRYPEAGSLPDFEFHYKVTMMKMTFQGTNRRIVGTERIKTEAGTFDCFIMEETITSKAMMMKEVERNVGWYAYGIGLVKEVTYDKKGNLISTMTLNNINW